MNAAGAAGRTHTAERAENRRWLREQMNPYFFIAMKDEPEALAVLTRELGMLRRNKRLILADRDKALIVAMVNQPGTLYETLRRIQEREISYAMIAHSDDPIPGLDQNLEIQRFEFDRKTNDDILAGRDVQVPLGIRRTVAAAVRKYYPDFDLADLDRLLRILWLNNENYVRISPPRRVAQVLRLHQEGNRCGGLYLDVEEMENGTAGNESRVFFAVGNPPQKDFLLQVMEVFNRLELGVNRAYCLTISNGIHPYFLGTFYVRRRDGEVLQRGSELFSRLQRELSNTQLLATRSHAYREFVITGLMSGEDATLTNAFIAFCHSNLAHNQPDRFGLDDVRGAFLAHPEIALQLAKLFRARFDPAVEGRAELYERVLAETRREVADYNTGHRYLDEVRRTIFHCCLTFITRTLKTNFFVLEKQALAFRLDPAYLTELGTDFTADLPPAMPFRVTFFFSRFGFGYHIGFSDIARGGWRTVICRTPDDLVTNANTLFRENFVLAHTQHLKNKDIYEGGSKLVVALDASDLKAKDRPLETWRLYKLQYGITGAFLDIFTTDNGVARHPAVVDYYREDEPIELGPDENMHDNMIETIAWMSKRRGYMLGIGIMSSKRVGINHKEYGVTSTGVVAFAEITMAELGIDIRRDPFTVKFTGGPNGDVAGNALRIMLERCPKVKIGLILDGTAALCDPEGADHGELGRILLKEDLDAFDPAALHPGGFMLFRTGSRREGLRELFRRVIKTDAGLVEEWISLDEFSKEFGELIFSVPADLFIPAGGRPETIDKDNWDQFLLPDGTPSARAIVEGANSFITPPARVELQKKGIIVMRDASANKCGVISSSYEIIANLLLTEKEFMEHKERYVADVLRILEKRAGDEARLILKRRREQPGTLCTEISDSLSTEINANYARLFRFFQARPELCLQPLYRRAILAHLPKIIAEEARFRRRLTQLPQKYLSAILAAEIGSSMVYRGDRETEFEDMIKLHLMRSFSAI
ncbi:NAD-glutamate dehydrogenase [Geobacter sulfurreducens]|jgi:glutamate dehydrogenase|uniref:Glu/Leu/Phe/Val dehydrogenase superfamily protein n=1 Tax=Geobacter sulfurreducens (strain ATCC 51573 / DSM 12127 / PCA) TaxID=243231 RepID=Q74CV7_GEOSL|nr:NAD-glutamate dehydrogenase domain-containing protein [Geobacter sulfurreducens]AAR34938.2 Glu/Leu/Phe/Val dehydrogenase superfamily protein [Geobacter sulfurreducens PCA]ADI84398.1 Glu/Leu/Phe/Val dehydrogenase superfamily protein [Geobacter sulfurreducens KN400]AJY71554.1 amino acid dehydrogenase [Geobacter sulfurreducens]UAC05569.1 NAD-glutamate dehydrogenase [Geobacter sulfurreducens]UTG94204.1 NAD-glutamate dehydrogenase [Geobacter sulfurreducens]